MGTLSIVPETDETLVEQIKLNKERALELLFKRYYSSLVRFAKGILKTQTDAEDIVQAVFIKIWEGREELAIHTAIKSYLYMAVKNRCFNQLKQNERKYWMDDSFEDDLRLSSDTIMSDISAKTLDQQITHAINQLPPKCGVIFKLSRFEDKSYKEIAEILDISVKTVENQMGKALQLLRGALGTCA